MKDPAIHALQAKSLDDEIALIRDSGLFDCRYYAEQTGLNGSPDVLIKHYLEIGCFENRAPNIYFDDRFYRDAAKFEAADTKINPLLHYIEYGAKKGIRPGIVFDPEYYLFNNADVRESGIDPLRHFLNHGAKERRIPSKDLHKLFDAQHYKKQLQEPEEDESLLEHYLQNGLKNRLDPNALFDAKFYLENYPDIKINPLVHYLSTGAKAGARTHRIFDSAYYNSLYNLNDYEFTPLHHYLHIGIKNSFKPSVDFDPIFYTRCYPDVATSGLSPLEHFLKLGLPEGRVGSGGIPSGFSKSAYIQMRQIEPLLPESKNLDALTEYVIPAQSSVGRAYFKLANSIQNPFSHLFVLKWLQHGGADLVSINYIRSVVEKFGLQAPYVILTSNSQNEGLDWLPAGVRYVRLNDLDPSLTFEEKKKILLKLIIQSGPKLIHNINSEECWHVYRDDYAAIKRQSKLTGCFFSLGRDQDSVVVGQASQYLNSCIDQLDLLFTDTQSFVTDLINRYAIEKSHRHKLIAIPTPSREEFVSEPAIKVSPTSRKSVLWASRFSPEKRPDVLAKIARSMPEVTFKVWGGDYTQKFDIDELKTMSNVDLCGGYTQFRDVVLNSDSYVFLYTSDFDGLPNVLLEAAANSLAIVAPDVGGIHELVTNETGWLIPKSDDVAAYVMAISEALANDDERNLRLAKASALLIKKHSWSSFREAVQTSGYLDS
jgi:glycosyltransferase involved in cell wall biosynthesis